MKRIIALTIVIIGLLLITGCTNGTDNGNDNHVAITTPPATQTADPTPQPPTNQSHQHTLEELGVTIIAAGAFWEDFWAMRGIFAWEHFDNTPWEYWIEQPMHPLSRGFQRVLPSFVFQSISEVGEYLRQFYTDEGVNREIFGRELLGDGDMFLGTPWAFEEYGEFGYLYVLTARIGTFRPDWATATHTLIEQDGNHAVVETIVLAYDHMGMGVEMPTATFRFIFIDGRIDSGLGRWNEWEFLNMTATYDEGAFSPVIEIEGAWTNRLGETTVFHMPNISDIRRTPNGAYVLEISWDVGESRVWLFPAYVEMIRYNALNERMYNESVVSDTSQVRLFAGDFEVTSCCTDEDINLTLFFRQP